MKNGYLIVGILFLLASAVAGWACLRNFSMAQASINWLKTSGKIIRSELQDLSIGKRENFRASVEYTYTVGGVIHRGTRIRFADVTGSAADKQRETVEQYPVNATVDVYYDPKDPGQAVLESGGGLRAYGLMIPPVVMAGIGMILLIYGRRRALGRL